MKILVICQYYSPEPFRISDICEEFLKQGNQVDVVTSFPNYPMGEIYEDYKNRKKKNEIINGVNVHRVFTIGRKTGALRRALNYFAYSISSSLYVNRLKNDYDVVFVYQLSPVIMAKAALKYKKKHGKKVVLYCLDIWPESLCIGGIKKSSLIYRYFERVSREIYSSVDKIIVPSKTFQNHFVGKYRMSQGDVVYLPQCTEDIFTPLEMPKNNIVNLTFAGNIGLAQSAETIIKAAAILKDEKIRFNIVGDGVELENIKSLAKKLGLKNVVFYGRKPVGDMPAIYGMSDAMLVTLSDDFILSQTFPGKVQSYMAAGKPIIGAVNGETARIIEEAGCGFCAPAKNAEALAECIKHFLVFDKELLEKKAVEYYNKNFRKELFVDTLVDELQKQAR